jgi:hypothetical protein
MFEGHARGERTSDDATPTTTMDAKHTCSARREGSDSNAEETHNEALQRR